MLVSIVIPMFNAERWISETLDSIARQGHRNWELIVVDDGSTDGALSLVERFTESVPQPVTLVSTPNRGVSSARNTGMAKARGDAIALLDADDVWLPNKLALQVRLLQAQPSAVAVGGSYTIADEALAHRLRTVRCDWSRQSILDWLLLESLGVLLPSTILMRSEAVASIGAFDESLSTAADLDYAWRLVNLGEVLTLQESLVLYRTSATQMHRDTGLLERDYAQLLEREPFVDNPRLRQRASVNLALLGALRTARSGHGFRGLASGAAIALRHPITVGRTFVRQVRGRR